MPRIWYEQGFVFSFYASDGHEPPHVHVFKDGHEAKWWLDPPGEEFSRGYNAKDRARIKRIVASRRGTLVERWHAFFSATE